MSNRQRGRVIGEIKPISDKSKLLWERYYKHMQGAAAALNAAIQNTENIIGGIILEAEGLSPDTHMFDPAKMRAVPRPRAKDNGNA